MIILILILIIIILISILLLLSICNNKYKNKNKPISYYSLYPPPPSPSPSPSYIISKSNHQPIIYHWSISSSSTTSSSLSLCFPTNHHPIYLSIIIPAWNEQTRLPIMLTDMLHNYLLPQNDDNDNDDDNNNTFFYTYPYWEILIVDDGSTDNTIHTVLQWWSNNTNLMNHLTIISVPTNMGKGHAVKLGILHARGDVVLFVDADGATKFTDINRLLFNLLPILQSHSIITTTNIINHHHDNDKDLLNHINTWNYISEWSNKIPAIVIGSRAHLVNTNVVVKRSLLRNILMYTFHGILHMLAGPIRHIGDTQCGFKLLTKAAIPHLIPGLQVKGWIFDIELLLRAYWLNIPIKEVMVTWNEINGSKLLLIRDSIRMLMDLLRLRYQYAIGNWKV